MANKFTHPKYVHYLEMIVAHENYKGIPFSRNKNGEINCVATGKSKIGMARQEWANMKKKELAIDNIDGSNAKLMYALHPTKVKPCQTCGKPSEISYVYPTKNTIKKLDTLLGVIVPHDLTFKEIVDLYVDDNKLKVFIKFLKEELSIISDSTDLDILIELAEHKCRVEGHRKLSPGAMSNFPDRLDGFHSYNRCCRTKHDTGRSKENMATYNKDRRAYEFLSDGNIHAANKFMRAEHFRGLSADHIGPISLGFVHDPRYIEPLKPSDNSSKRDRLDKATVERIILIENESGAHAVSWFAQDIWDSLKVSHARGEGKYKQHRDAFKINMISFLKLLHDITEICEGSGWDFIYEIFVRTKADYFNWDYDFKTNGEITRKHKRRIGAATKKESLRFKNVVNESIASYSAKSNRKNKEKIIKVKPDALGRITKRIASTEFYLAREELRKLAAYIQEQSLIIAFRE